jgi:putative pyruvate formate lyase activating enzyme
MAVSPVGPGEGLSLLKAVLKRCVFCPRKCRVDRTFGERGFCGLACEIIVSHALPHHGEEPPISGDRGAGTVFFSSCNLGCCYCQNYQISQALRGRRLSTEGLSRAMLDLWKSGCHNIEAVTPTPQLFRLVEAFLKARGEGLDIPLVYNCGGYENPDMLRLLEGVVDVYLPDFKYGSEEDALELSRVADYPRWALESLKEMMRQAGDSLVTEDGIAVKGMIVRHLVLPGKLENSMEVLRLIRKHLSLHLPLSLMSQYTPTPPVKDHPLLGRRVTRDEYEAVVNMALDMGFEHLYTQDVDEQALSPDFDRERPFQWVEPAKE